VLSLPDHLHTASGARLRPYLHHRPEVASAVLSLFVRALRGALRGSSPDAPRSAAFAAISFPQRFGNSLNPHFHFHVLALDGVFSEEPPGSGEVVFHEATRLTPEHWQTLERTVQRRVLWLFRKRRLLDDATVQDMLGWQASGGFSVDASVRIEGHDRAGLERLVRYCARPPLALERLLAGGSSALYNLGNGAGYSVREVVKAAERVTGRRIPVATGPRRPGDPATLVASSAKIARELGWKPRFGELDAIISTAWRWHESHPDGYGDRTKAARAR